MMRRFVILSAIIVVAPSMVAPTAASLSEWHDYKTIHGKFYSSGLEDSWRRALFAKNKQTMEKFNAEQSATAGYKMGLSHLSDWTRSELLASQPPGYRSSADRRRSARNSPHAEEFLAKMFGAGGDSKLEPPAAVDWRRVPGRVTPVKDQGRNCSSGWAFSATGVLEGQELSITNGSKLVGLSEQNIMDCAEAFACYGGRASQGIFIVQLQGGIEDELSYPYEATNSKGCHFNRSKSILVNKGVAVLPANDEEFLKRTVANYGPVSVAIDVEESLIRYKSGVYRDESCAYYPDKLNHSVLIVGYGTDSKQGDFWLVKNSWGVGWGEGGYFRIARNSNNMCRIARDPVIAIF